MSKPIFNYDDFDTSYVMHCKTEDEARTFLSYLISIGEEWCSGESYEDTKYSYYGENTCYNFRRGQFCDLDYFVNHDYNILSVRDFDWGDSELPTCLEAEAAFHEFISTFSTV